MLRVVDTEYFISCDGDDWYDNNVVKVINDYLSNNGDFGYAVIPVSFFDESLSFLYTKKMDERKSTQSLLYDCVYSNIPCFTGIHINNIRSFYKNNNNELTIYDSKYGQNWQLLLPMVKNEVPVFLGGASYCYLMRNNSLSRSVNTFDDMYQQYIGKLDILEQILSKLGENRLLDEIKKEYNTELCNVAFKLKKRKVFLSCYKNSNKTFKRYIKKIIIGLLFWEK